MESSGKLGSQNHKCWVGLRRAPTCGWRPTITLQLQGGPD